MRRGGEQVDGVIAGALTDREIAYRRPTAGSFLVTLPGTRKLATMCWLVVGEHALLVEAFVLRRPDEDREKLYSLLLRRNARMYGVAWSIDAAGDVYLVGRVALHSVTPAEIDRLLGAVLTYADDTFNLMLQIGFGSSIRREWAWRRDRGESTANLAAFARFADPDRE
ncbi:MAG: YbjN domain-containing protein [Mycobacteriales bacterium]